VEAAEQLLNKILESNPRELGALVARGTARALRRDLKGADRDFTEAIKLEPK
jgi:Flp pilus assembly protein TadD